MIKFTIELNSDAELGSGLGGETVNSYVTRDSAGRPVIHASHVKGLIRQALVEILAGLGWDPALVDGTLGSPGWRPLLEGTTKQLLISGSQSPFSFRDALWDEDQDPSAGAFRLISRTALDPATGTVQSHSLRTTEAVIAGSKFRGTVYGTGSEIQESMLRMGLLSLRAVGASRNRGAGRCTVTIDNETRTPGAILLQVDGLRAAPEVVVAQPSQHIPASECPGTSVAWFDIVFVAESGVLCPEMPETLNVLRAGVAIPASAVQGVVLHAINRLDPDRASRCFEDPRFRAWPLHPCAEIASEIAALPWPVRVSLTHKTAKIISTPSLHNDFEDEAVEAIDWTKRPSDAPILKNSDGLLLRSDNRVHLWKSGDIPRVFSTHAVHSDPVTPGGRNVYSIEAIAPLVWRGMLSCPAELAQIVTQALDGAEVSFGKARSVRGMGRLTLRQVASPTEIAISQDGPAVLIAQAPLLLEDRPAPMQTVASELESVARAWAEQCGLGAVEAVWAGAGLRFGWNRHGQAGAAAHGRTRASRVVLPGAVIRLKQVVDASRLEAALLLGIGGGRERGYGCLLPHPGKAQDLYRRSVVPIRLSPSRHGEAIRLGLKLATGTSLSASQVSTLLGHLRISRSRADDFLRQQKARGPRYWSTWERSFTELKGWTADPAAAIVSLEVARDILVGKDGEAWQP